MERLDRGEKALLEVGEQEARPGAAGRGLPVLVEHGGQSQFRRVRRQAVDPDGLDDAFRKGLPKSAEVFLEPADHDRLQLFGLDVDAPGEALRIEDFEERREGVGMTVVRGGGQEKPVFEKRRDLPHGPRELAFQGPDGSGGGRRMVRLVEDQHRAGPERRKEFAEPAHVHLVGQDAVGDDEARADAPRIGGKPARPPGVQEVLAVDDGEVEAEFLRQLVLPLQQHRGRRRDDDHLNAAAQEQLSNDQTGFHRLAEADVVGDQQIDAWQVQRLGQGKKLVGVQPDARPKRRLEQLPIRRRGGPPFRRAQVSAQALGPFEGLGQQGRPVVRVEDLRLQLGRESKLDCLALRIVLAGNEVQRLHRPGLFGPLDDPGFSARKDEVALLGSRSNLSRR